MWEKWNDEVFNVFMVNSGSDNDKQNSMFDDDYKILFTGLTL